jgi:hypothetical protein
MSKSLPTGGFYWLTESEIEELDVTKCLDTDSSSYILEVDLRYPRHLHETHAQLPLAPEHIQVQSGMLSDAQNSILLESATQRKQCGDVKLIPNLYDKERYVVHAQNLKLYLSLGMEVVKVHRVLGFEQCAWLRGYIAMNTRLRRKAKSKFSKDFFKLRNNSVFGKCMENIRNRLNVDLVTTRKKFLKLAAKPTFKTFSIFHEELVGITRYYASVTMTKPIAVGFAVLELSKLRMFDFYYNQFVHIFPDHKVLFTDTDSLAVSVRCNDPYKLIGLHSCEFDTSDFPTTHPQYSPTNKKKAGKFHDELAGRPMKEFVGLRAKMYSFTVDEAERKVAKGIGRTAIRQDLKFDQYKSCLENQTKTCVRMQQIRSVKHKLHTVDVTKIGLSSFDDKRYIESDGIATLPHGHHRIPRSKRKAFVRNSGKATNVLFSSIPKSTPTFNEVYSSDGVGEADADRNISVDFQRGGNTWDRFQQSATKSVPDYMDFGLFQSGESDGGDENYSVVNKRQNLGFRNPYIHFEASEKTG